MKKASIFIADGFEEIEALTPVDVLRRANVEVSIVSMNGKKEVTGAHGITVIADQIFENNDNTIADMLILPGGMPNTKTLDDSKELKELLISYNNKKHYIAAICAAPSILGKLGIMAGKTGCCYPGYEQYMKDCNVATYNVVVDGNIITSRGAGTAMEFALKLVEILVDKKMADQLKATMQVTA